MIKVIVFEGEQRNRVGDFRFTAVPRAGEDVTVPWPADQFGVRIFAVDEVLNIADGVDNEDAKGPAVHLHTTEYS